MTEFTHIRRKKEHTEGDQGRANCSGFSGTTTTIESRCEAHIGMYRCVFQGSPTVPNYAIHNQSCSKDTTAYIYSDIRKNEEGTQ